MHELTWEQILKGIDSALKLCCALGLEQAVQASRFLEHRERLALLVNALEQEGPDGARKIYDTDRLSHIVALTEAGELASIEQFLQLCEPTVLRPKLLAALGGPVLPDEEDQNSNYARNILFELNLGAKLLAAGLAPALGERPDLVCEVEGKRLLIECKRAMTKRGAQQSTRRAWRQLEARRRQEPPGARGLVALSVSKLINPGDAIFSAPDEATAREGLRDGLFAITDAFAQTWNRPGTGVVGVIFHVITPAYIEDGKVLALQQRTHGHGLAAEGSLDWLAFRELIRRLETVWY